MDDESGESIKPIDVPLIGLGESEMRDKCVVDGEKREADSRDEAAADIRWPT